jgi:hypothetical protein
MNPIEMKLGEVIGKINNKSKKTSNEKQKSISV